MIEPRITLYCENYNALKGSGMGVAFERQKNILLEQNIFFTEDLSIPTNIFQANTPGLRTLWLMKKFKKQNKKIIIYAHVVAEQFEDGSFRFLSPLKPLIKKYFSYIFNLADLVICPSEYTARLLNENYDIAKEKTVAISCGVDIHKFQWNEYKREEFRKKYGIKKKDPLIINTAMAIRRKGIDTFIKMSELFPDIKFIWAGKKYKFLAKKVPSHPDNAQFIGLISDVATAYSAADILLYPSYQETQGLSPLEAASVRLPIIVRNLPVYNDWLIDGQNCLKAKNDEEFRECIEKMANDGELRKKLGQRARLSVIEKHSFEAIGNQLKKTYNQLLN